MEEENTISLSRKVNNKDNNMKLDSNGKEQFRSEMELKFWAEIYKNSCGGESAFSEENPAADSADMAIDALRERLQYLTENPPPAKEGEAPAEKQSDFLSDGKGGAEPSGPGGHHNSPK